MRLFTGTVRRRRSFRQHIARTSPLTNILEHILLSSLSIRTKLLVNVAFPLVAILGLAAVAYPTFETVKVNGPQYGKIRAAKDLEADILPPPGFGVEAFLDAGLLIEAPNLQRRNQLATEIRRLHDEFTSTHTKWQADLAKNDAIRGAMSDASKRGEELFAAIQLRLVGPSEQFFDADPIAASAAREQAKATYAKELLPLFESHKVAVNESVRLSLERQDSVEAETRSLVSSRLLLMAVATLSAFALIALVASTIARSIRKPIQALTDSARNTAEHELPETVARIQAGGSADTHEIRSAFADNTDEIGELARAFDSMHASSVRLAAEQARIRRNVADNLINIGRRSQGLLKRNLSQLTKMENDERDAVKLDQLFRLDHLTTRMRRNAESILVLAGSESPKVWAQPMPVEDMVRSALGQIEAYDRVELGHLDLARLRGNAIGDLSHLLAELLENATQFSPPKSRVTVFGKQRLDGYLLVISDDGVGMTAAEFERVNNVLNNPAEFDTEATKVLGHIVVGRLALRHGVRVRVTESATTGVAAQILIPRNLIEDDVPLEAPGSWVGAADGLSSGPGTNLGSSGPATNLGESVDDSSGFVPSPDSSGFVPSPDSSGFVPSPDSWSALVNAGNTSTAAVSEAPSAPTFITTSTPASSTPDASTPAVWASAPLASAAPVSVASVPSPGLPVRQAGLSPLQSRAAQVNQPGIVTPSGDAQFGTPSQSALATEALPSRVRPAQSAQSAQPAQSAQSEGSLTQRVRGAQLPVTTLTPNVAAEPRDASAMRTALSSLQRGMEAAKSDPAIHGTQSQTNSSPPTAFPNTKDSL
jgi:signal transduction histidine kinase